MAEQLREKHVIFARHGQSIANEKRIHQGSDVHLTMRGREQASQAIAEFERRRITALISSGEVRAIQSVAPARGRLMLPAEISELLNEFRRPSELIGLSSDDPTARAIMMEIEKGYFSPGHHYSDEENLNDLFARGSQIFEMLLKHSADCIGIFSHAHVLRALHVIANSRFNPTPEKFFLDYQTLPLENGAICCFTYKKGHKSEEWWWHATSWNETGHLL